MEVAAPEPTATVGVVPSDVHSRAFIALVVAVVAGSGCGPGARTPPGGGDGDGDVDADGDGDGDADADADGDGAPPGDECLPRTVPEGGFFESEVYIEVDSPDCSSGPCIVNHLQGDPTETDPGQQSYVSPAEIELRVYCTCKCAAEAAETIVCPTCPDEFECCPAFTIGPPDLRGSYCVRAGTCGGG